jgi:O-antigen biosynthesis protein
MRSHPESDAGGAAFPSAPLPEPRESAPPRPCAKRPVVRGKFLFVGDGKFLVRGVTYGPFRPNEVGCLYHNPQVVRRDFAAMSARGINTLRTYTCPPRWLLDVAAEQGLRVMVGVGLAGEQLSAFLESRQTVRRIFRRCADGVRACAEHPALLAYGVGNEIPATIVRWHGRRRVERFLSNLCQAAREHDPGGLVTYVNYPTTEYLQLPFLDFLSYNVYLESPERFDAYLARLQNIADDKPLVMAEIGLDSRRNGLDAQAEAVEWQVRRSFAGGCAGAFVFAWTDEWHTGGADVENWEFGVTDAERKPKPALRALARAFAEAPLPPANPSPRISVVVCTHNGGRTIRDCLAGCARLDYPNYEVIVVNDGSTDDTAEIVRRFDVRLINTPNNGLSRARNVGLSGASGEIIAYLDDDAWPDEHWLRYLADTFLTSDHAGVGGPNIVPQDDPPFAQCVADAPGGPTHVLLTDRVAEHIPGCNMAFRVHCLREIEGFDARFRIAGDDVDLCWRLQAHGWSLGFNPAAVVWHRRRRCVRGYWKQQFNYGRAEAMLEAKWPEKYNVFGHVGWQGRLYGSSSCRPTGWQSSRVYRGVWASSPFQTLCASESVVCSLPLMPEWYLGIAGLIAMGVMGVLWSPLLLCLALAAIAGAATVVQSARGASGASLAPVGRAERLRRRGTTALLYLIQPAARLCGRLSYGLTPWRRQMPRSFALPVGRSLRIWSELWQPPEERLRSIEALLKERRVPMQRGGAYDDWDLEIRGGLFACARTRLGIEEYPRGRQYLRFRAWPCFSKRACLVATLPVGLSAFAALQHASAAAVVLAVLAGLLILRAWGDCGAAMSCLMTVFQRYGNAVREIAATHDVSPELPRDPQLHRAAEPNPLAELKTLPESPARDGAPPTGTWDADVAWASVLEPADTVRVHPRRGRSERVEHAARAPDDDAAKSLGK